MRDNSLIYTLTTPGGVVTFQRGTNIFFKDVDWSAQINAEISERPQMHGGYYDAAFKSGGVWTGTAWLQAMRVAGATIEANRTSVVKAINSIMDADGTLGFTNTGSSTPLALTVRAMQDVKFNIGALGWIANVMLYSEKPFAEDATATTVDTSALTAGGGGFVIPLTLPTTFTASSGGTSTVTNNGDFYAYPKLRVYGPITNPNVINSTLGQRLVFSGSIADGDYWEIDLFEKTVRLNGLTSIRALTVASSSWFKLGFGNTDLQLSGSGYNSNTKLRALMKSAWG